MKYQNHIEPENCSGMDDIRIEIDTMDRDSYFDNYRYPG
ncbi:MAG: hypothetical protein ACI9W6_002265 [Motiliproteus sp.]|jgi:hypothetical protein